MEKTNSKIPDALYIKGASKKTQVFFRKAAKKNRMKLKDFFDVVIESYQKHNKVEDADSTARSSQGSRK